MVSDETEIKALEQRVADSAKARDVNAIMNNYMDDDALFVFDVVPPRHVGAKGLRKNWQGFFDGFDGPITVENSEMSVTSDDKLAYAHYVAHIAGKGKMAIR